MDEPTLNENPATEEGSSASSGPSDAVDAQGSANSETEMLDLVQKLTLERDQLQEQVLRTMADFQNFRKRNQAESLLLRQYATQALVEQLLPVLDNFERTVKASDSGATLESILNGVRAIERQLKSAVESQGVQRIPAIGQIFDANLHEAIATVPSEEHEADTVIDEVEAGYKMGDRIIRVARVRVTTKP